MSAMVAAALVVGFALAAANGANDTSKGVATLVGAGLADADRATAWGLLWTAIGAAVAAFTMPALMTTFGPGLLGADAVPAPAAALSALAGVVGWVALATRYDLPVSTTHAIVGSVAGAATAAYGPHGFAWGVVATKIVLPMLVGPLVAVGLGAVAVQLLPSAGSATLDRVHWASSAGVCAARAMNDTPKITAVVLSATALAGAGAPSVTALFAIVTAGMLAGGWFAGRGVTARLATGLTSLDHRSGLGANLVAASLVSAATWGGLPLSTTHVASGGIVGAGRRLGIARPGVLRDVVLGWVVTAPAAAVLAAAAYTLAAWA